MADDFTQANRRLRIETPLGPDALLITALSGTEGVSTLFHFQAELLGRDEQAKFDDIVGKNVTISIAAGKGDRYLNGIVSRFSQSGTVGEHAHYRADIVPWTWFLTRTSDCRIFQKKSVPDIVKQIFGEYGFSDYKLQLGSHQPREYCVQYRETDFNFIARLLEEEGIFFFFDHADGKHTMIISDGSRSADPCRVLDHARFVHEQVSLDEDDVVTWFAKEQEVRAAKYSLTDYDFEKPSLDLAANATGSDQRKYELYDYPAGGTTRDRTQSLARLRQEEEDTSRVVFRGHGYVRSFTPGFKFSLASVGVGVGSTYDGSYVLTSLRHHASESYGQGEGSDSSYENEFECIDPGVHLRPPRHTARPVVHGVQTAVVVGPGGEEIYVDKYSRVKVQFFWDREGKRNENSSCWLRVSTSWAGKNWGMVSIPRIGQEVIVSFLEGDPDQPIIVGSVYNGEQMPPYDLPGNKTQSGLKSRSSLSGTPANFNEIRFEDKKGSEELYLHAEKDETIVVENDKSESVGADETISIGHDRTETVGHNETITVQNDRAETVVGNETLTVAKNRVRTVQQNEVVTVYLTRTQSVGVNDMLNVGAAQEITVVGARAVSVGGAQLTTVGLAHSETSGLSRTMNVRKKFSLDAGDEVSIVTGGASINMKKDGTIDIKGKDVTIEATAKLTLKGANVTSEASAKHETKGNMVNAEADAINTIKGASVKINS
jgi:type VI secretion system secreted protein VgrG